MHKGLLDYMYFKSKTENTRTNHDLSKNSGNRGKYEARYRVPNQLNILIQDDPVKEYAYSQQ